MSARRQRFTARIQKSGVKACVDVPRKLSRALGSEARSGRIRVEGLLNETPVRGTLVPLSSAGHRFFVNQAVLRAASVEVGETVRLELRPSSWEFEIPRDVAAELRRVRGALGAFQALAPSHRRELVRYIDDAKTKEARRRRIVKAAEHALGKPSKSARGRKGRPLWTCTRCGNEFVNRNQYHSCKRVRLQDVFAGRSAHVRDLFKRLRTLVESMGPVKLVPYAGRVGFMVRVRFAGAAPRSQWLDVSFWLPRRLESPRFRRVETLLPNAHVHWLRVKGASDLDEELSRWLREAYDVGCQKHLA